MNVIMYWTATTTAALLLVTSGHTQSTTDGALPVCNSAASDADGDGFGWELIPTISQYGSCRITAESEPAPQVVNRETGAPVNLVRAFWDANRDIAGRTLRCEYFQHDQSSATYIKVDPPINDAALWQFKDTLYRHDPLSSELPRTSTMLRLAVDQLTTGTTANNITATNPLWGLGLVGTLPLWTVNDGIYQGDSPLQFSPYLEVTNHGSGTDNAVRIWNTPNQTAEQASGDYFVCYSPDGNPLVPTGAPGMSVTPFINLDESLVVAMTTEEPSQEYLDQETGQPVVFINGLWNYNTQIAMRVIRCREHVWEWREPSVYGAIDLDDSLAGWEYIFHPYTGGETVMVSRRSFTSRDRPFRDWQTNAVSIAAGQLGSWTAYDRPFSGWEQTGDDFRLWNIANNDTFQQCSVSKLTQVRAPIFSIEESFAPIALQENGTGGSGSGGQTEVPTNPTESGTSTSAQSGGGGSTGYLALYLLLLFSFRQNKNLLKH